MATNRDLKTYWTMSPIYYTVRVFGLAPYSIARDESKTGWKVTKLTVFYNIITMLLISMIAVPMLIYQNNVLDSMNADNITKSTDLFRRMGGIIVCFVCVLFSFVNRHKTCKLMEDMNDFDRDIGRIGITVNYKGMRRSNAICIVVIYSMIIPVTILDLTVYNTIIHKYFMYWIVCVVLFLVNFSMVIQFVGFAHTINTRFMALNKFMMELFKPSIGNRLIKTNTWTTKQSHKMTTGSLAVTEIIDSKKNYINTVCAMHYNLCEMGKELNAIYSIQILLTTGMSFTDILTRLYRLYLLLTSNDYFKLTYTLVWNRITWGMMFSQMIILISFFCSKTKKEANKSSILLHQTNFEDDDEIRTSVEMFYLQMLHQRFEFSAGGFFPVDSSVLYMVMGTITTYIVILIQFQMADTRAH